MMIMADRLKNRIRLTTEVTKSLCDVWGAGRVSVRLSPNGDSQGCDDSQPEALFTAAATALSNLGIGFLELREPGPDGTFGNTDVPKQSPAIRKVFKGALVTNSDLTAESGQALLDFRRGGCCQLWPRFHGQSGSAPALQGRPAAQRVEGACYLVFTWS